MSVINCESSFPDGHDRTSHQEPNDTKDTDPVSELRDRNSVEGEGTTV
jgi:hypothetical protein